MIDGQNQVVSASKSDELFIPAEPASADAPCSEAAAPAAENGTVAEIGGARGGAAEQTSRIKIGSQREGSRPPKSDPTPISGEAGEEHKPAEPRTTRLAAQVSSELKHEVTKVPVPSLRRDLPPDLQVELELAMGGKSLDELISDASLSQAGEELAPESRLRGRVVSLHKENVFVDVRQPMQGVIPLSQFAEPPAIGAEIEIVVTRFDGDEGLYQLTLPGGAVSVEDWGQVAEGMVVEARVTGVNKGGLECEVNQLRGFIPASQTGLYRVEDLSTLVGEKWPCVITSVNPEKRNLVLSRRAYLERERESARKELLASLAVGQIREGIVRNLQAFGAFIDLGGIDGLVHISEISWQRVNQPSDFLQVGQPVKVKIRKIDPETGKISLGMKELSNSPWDQAAAKYPAKSTVTGKVAKIMEFGAFVELEPGVEGLLHISELDYKRVFRVSDVLSLGQEIEAQVLSVDPGQRRIALSMKALKTKPQPEVKPEPKGEEPALDPTPARHARKLALKGGRNSTAGGERFGLKW